MRGASAGALGRAHREVRLSAPGPGGWREPASQTSPHKPEPPTGPAHPDLPHDPGTSARQEVTYTCLGPVCVSRPCAHPRALPPRGAPRICPEVTSHRPEGAERELAPAPGAEEEVDPRPGSPHLSASPTALGSQVTGPGHPQPGPGSAPSCPHSPLMTDGPAQPFKWCSGSLQAHLPGEEAEAPRLQGHPLGVSPSQGEGTRQDAPWLYVPGGEGQALPPLAAGLGG